MSETVNVLRTIHAKACVAVEKADRSLTPAGDGFWPLYIQAILETTEGRSDKSLLSLKDAQRTRGTTE